MTENTDDLELVDAMKKTVDATKVLFKMSGEIDFQLDVFAAYPERAAQFCAEAFNAVLEERRVLGGDFDQFFERVGKARTFGLSEFHELNATASVLGARCHSLCDAVRALSGAGNTPRN